MRFFNRLDNIDSRILYILLAAVIIIPLIVTIDQPIDVGPAVLGSYQAVEDMPEDKMAIIVVYWGSGTIAENRPQIEAVMHHLFRLDKKFAVLAFNDQGSTFALESARRIAAEYDKEYGADWIHWGYKPPANLIPLVQSFPRGVIETMIADHEGVPLERFPVMEGIRTIEDIGLIVDTTSVGELEVWIGYVYGSYRTPIIYGPTAVMAPEGYNPLDAGQIKGMLPGLQGAAAYEVLLGRKDFATRAMGALSSSHGLIIFMIILGNIGYLSSRRRRRES